MRTTVAALAALLTVGCANTPRGMVEEGPPSAEWTSARAAAETAACIARNADEMDFGLGVSYPSSMRPGVQPGSFEIIQGGFGRLFFYGIVDSAPPGSKARIWKTRGPFLLLGNGSLEEQVRKGCD